MMASPCHHSLTPDEVQVEVGGSLLELGSSDSGEFPRFRV